MARNSARVSDAMQRVRATGSTAPVKIGGYRPLLDGHLVSDSHNITIARSTLTNQSGIAAVFHQKQAHRICVLADCQGRRMACTAILSPAKISRKVTKAPKIAL